MGLAVLAPPAEAALVVHPTEERVLTIASAARVRCATTVQSGPHVATSRYTAPGRGTITVQLAGPGTSDFDVGIVDLGTGRVVSGSATFGSTESASAFVADGDEIDVQVCRRKGASAQVTRRVFFTEDDEGTTGRRADRLQLAEVRLTSRADADRLSGLGLDLVDSPHGDRWDVYLHSARDARRITAAGLRYRVTDRDVARTVRRDTAIARRAARAAQAQGRALTPGGRTDYRTLPMFEEELKDLTERHPGLVRPVTLARTTWDGRQVVGIEIAQNVNAADGRPTYVQVGTHHAREWPAPEATFEFGLELIKNHLRDPAYLDDRDEDPRLRRIVTHGRTLVIPVLNPDGYDVSRQSGLDTSGGFKRKNCRPQVTTPYVQCLARSLVESDVGVDPNRGYGLEWGGPGTSSNVFSSNYSGPAPWSEPELEGMRRLLRDRQATVLVTNHTYGGHLMRPPGTTRNAPTPDEPWMEPIGRAMAFATNYNHWFSYNLYNTTGSTSDYVYRGLGVFPFTPEIGKQSFAPPYTTGFVPEYDGRVVDGVKRGGLREAFTVAGLAAIDARNHSIIRGVAPVGRTLRITKTISYITSDRPNDDGFQWPVQAISEPRVSTMTVPAGELFVWHVSPSQQPMDRSRTTWRLTCESGGRVLDARDVFVQRGKVADVGGFCGAVDRRATEPPPPPGSPLPVPDDIPAENGSPPRSSDCAPIPAAFRFATAQPRGRGVLIRFSRVFPEEVDVTIFQLTRRGRRLRPPKVVRRLSRQTSFTWSGRDVRGRGLGEGLYRVRLSMVDEADVRHVTLRRRDGRFRLVGTSAARAECG